MTNKMKRTLILVTVALALAVAFASLSAAGTKGKLDLKAGDELYVCNCGEECPCNTIARHPGKCTCGHDEVVKATVTKVDGDTAYFKAEGWEKERPFKTVGKYACACKPGCNCDGISQTPGTCPCGEKMKKVK
jgi:hypothetical protein